MVLNRVEYEQFPDIVRVLFIRRIILNRFKMVN
ncbi:MULTISPECIES: hypothetical protein [Bacillaceae]|nr:MULTISPECIES: hypothetical protein [Bacillaceae]